MTVSEAIKESLVKNAKHLREIDKAGRAEGAVIFEQLRVEARTSPLVTAMRELASQKSR